MDNDDLYLGAVPPVKVEATNCHTVNVEVHLHVEHLKHDTLKRMVEAIEARIVGRVIDETG